MWWVLDRSRLVGWQGYPSCSAHQSSAFLEKLNFHCKDLLWWSGRCLKKRKEENTGSTWIVIMWSVEIRRSAGLHWGAPYHRHLSNVPDHFQQRSLLVLEEIKKWALSNKVFHSLPKCVTQSWTWCHFTIHPLEFWSGAVPEITIKCCLKVQWVIFLSFGNKKQGVGCSLAVGQPDACVIFT